MTMSGIVDKDVRGLQADERQEVAQERSDLDLIIGSQDSLWVAAPVRRKHMGA